MARTHLLAGSVEQIARLFGKWVVKRCNDSNSKCASQHPYFIHAVVSRIREGRKDRRSAAFRNAFSPRCRPSCNKDRKGRSRSLSCKTEGRPPRIINQSETFSLGRTTMRMASRDAWNIDPSDSSFRKKKNSLLQSRLSYRFPLRKRNVIFIRFEEENFLSRIWNDILESNIWRTSCLPNLRCVHALLRNSNWHARYGYATWMQTKH